MIRIRIDLVPYGYEDDSRAIGEIVLYNEGTGTIADGHSYTAYLKTTGHHDEVFKSRVTGFDRKKGILELIELVLANKEEIKEEDIDERIRDRFLYCKRSE